MDGTSKPRLLVVDDAEPNRRVLERLLRASGYEVDTAVNGQDGLQRLEAELFDLVLVDIMMPVLNGYEMLERLKADPRLRHLPVIVISALDDMENVVRCIEAGADDYLPKPFNAVLLRARITNCLEKKRLHDQGQLYMEAVRRELILGRQIQADFLPLRLPECAGWEIGAHFDPAHEVAGDFYDVFELHGGRLCLVIADICDKGIGAALFMALVRTLVRVFAELARPDGTPSPGALPRATLGALTAVRRTNDYLIAHHARTNMFASLFFAVLDPERGCLVYVNAGHDAPLHVGRSGLKARLTRTGPAVGTLPGAEYGWKEIAFDPEDVLFAYTDGVTEARSPTGAFYTEQRLVELVTGSCREGIRSGADLIERVKQAVSAHAAGADPSDDVTLLVLRRPAAPEVQ